MFVDERRRARASSITSRYERARLAEVVVLGVLLVGVRPSSAASTSQPISAPLAGSAAGPP